MKSKASLRSSEGAVREEVDRDRVDPDLREAIGQLLVIAMQAAHVRDHDHARAGGLGRAGRVGHHAGAVARGQVEVSGAGGAARDRRNRRKGIVVHAHDRNLL
jgi:hypothetical protein